MTLTRRLFVPPLHSPFSTLAEKATYLNFLYRVSNPAGINTYQPLDVYFGILLFGFRPYSSERTWRIVWPWRASPFGPVRTWATA